MEIIEIKGKVNTALCYAKVVEDEAIEQIRRMCDYPMTAGSRIRIMPDVHSGKGCTIGTTMTITDKAVPNVVGVDIGCGMYTVNLGKGEIDFLKVDEAAHYIPSGKNVWEGRKEQFDLTGLTCYRQLKDTKEQQIIRPQLLTTYLTVLPFLHSVLPKIADDCNYTMPEISGCSVSQRESRLNRSRYNPD